MSLWNTVCSVQLCYLWEKEQLRDSRGSFFSHRAHRVHGGFWRTFRAHRTPPAYRVHRALLLKVAVRFCEIGWLNVSVKLCVFCSSVFFCEKKNTPSIWDKAYETRCGVFSLTDLTDLTDPYSAMFRTHRTPSAYRVHRALLPKMAVRFCEIGWLNVSVHLCVFCYSVLFCEKKNIVGVCG